MKWTTEISEGQRLERIAELLCKGITLMLIREAKGGSGPAPPSSEQPTGSQVRHDAPLPVDAPQDCDETERNILAYLARVGEASPRQLQAALSASRATISRKLGHLQSIGRLSRRGRTSAARYEIVKAGKNWAIE